MVDPTMRYQNFIVDYTVRKIKRKGLVVYLEAGYAIDDAEPSYIMVLSALPLL
jgi:hypothetical protein